MSLQTRRFLEIVAYFACGLILVLFNSTAFYIYAAAITAIIIIYIIMSVTILPTLKKTVPNFFGDFKPINISQIIHSGMLIVSAWAPVALLIGGK